MNNAGKTTHFFLELNKFLFHHKKKDRPKWISEKLLHLDTPGGTGCFADQQDCSVLKEGSSQISRTFLGKTFMAPDVRLVRYWSFESIDWPKIFSFSTGGPDKHILWVSDVNFFLGMQKRASTCESTYEIGGIMLEVCSSFFAIA